MKVPTGPIDRVRQRWRNALRIALNKTGNEDVESCLDQDFLVVEVDNAEPIVGDLFRRRFHTNRFPDKPRHFVAFAKMPDVGLIPLGYVHYTIWQGCALCGGLVIDERRYRRLPPALRSCLHKAGGVAELLLRQSFSRLPSDITAIWGHVGDLQSERVCLRVGFEKTDKEFILVVWVDTSLSVAQKEQWVACVERIGPF